MFELTVSEKARQYLLDRGSALGHGEPLGQPEWRRPPGANLTDADLAGADLAGANLEGAMLTDAQRRQATNVPP